MVMEETLVSDPASPPVLLPFSSIPPSAALTETLDSDPMHPDFAEVVGGNMESDSHPGVLPLSSVPRSTDLTETLDNDSTDSGSDDVAGGSPNPEELSSSSETENQIHDFSLDPLVSESNHRIDIDDYADLSINPEGKSVTGRRPMNFQRCNRDLSINPEGKSVIGTHPMDFQRYNQLWLRSRMERIEDEPGSSDRDPWYDERHRDPWNDERHRDPWNDERHRDPWNDERHRDPWYDERQSWFNCFYRRNHMDRRHCRPMRSRNPYFVEEKPTGLGAGLHNLGYTCFLNAILQCFTHTVPLVEGLRSISYHKADDCCCEKFCVLCAMREHVELALASSGKSIPPSKFVDDLNHFSSSFQRYQQEDAHEFLQCLLEKLSNSCSESKAKDDNSPTKDDNLVNHVFGGCLLSKLKCCNCGHHSDTYEPLIDLSLEIEGVNTLSKALESFTSVEKIEDPDCKTKCDKCEELVTREKQLILDRAPMVAALHLKRFKSDGADIHKIDDHVEFPLELDMKPYTSRGQSNADVELKYRLYAVVVHHGRYSTSGHYFCYIRSAPDTWHKLDDRSVNRVEEVHVLSENAYVLFYAKESTPWFSNFWESQKLDSKSSLHTSSPKSVLENMDGESTLHAYPTKPEYSEPKESTEPPLLVQRCTYLDSGTPVNLKMMSSRKKPHGRTGRGKAKAQCTSRAADLDSQTLSKEAAKSVAAVAADLQPSATDSQCAQESIVHAKPTKPEYFEPKESIDTDGTLVQPPLLTKRSYLEWGTLEKLKMMSSKENNNAQACFRPQGWTKGGKATAKYTSTVADLEVTKEVAKSVAPSATDSQCAQESYQLNDVEPPKEIPLEKQESPEIAPLPIIHPQQAVSSIQKPRFGKKTRATGGLGARKLTEKLADDIYDQKSEEPVVLTDSSTNSSATAVGSLKLSFDYTDTIQCTGFNDSNLQKLSHVAPPESLNFFAELGVET